jgi:hypothetical protein
MSRAQNAVIVSPPMLPPIDTRTLPPKVDGLAGIGWAPRATVSAISPLRAGIVESTKAVR